MYTIYEKCELKLTYFECCWDFNHSCEQEVKHNEQWNQEAITNQLSS